MKVSEILNCSESTASFMGEINDELQNYLDGKKKGVSKVIIDYDVSKDVILMKKHILCQVSRYLYKEISEDELEYTLNVLD